MSDRRTWQLPAGVPPGSWHYFQSEAVAAGYDRELATHPLVELDLQFVQRFLRPGDRAVDLGCGTGRGAACLAQLGHQVVAVDLSQAMLEQLRRRPAPAAPGAIFPVRANLVQLDCLPDGYFRLALCLFSTLGMIYGARHRQAAVRHFARILSPGGTLILHVHNFWRELHEPRGVRRLAARALIASRGKDQIGDRRYLHPSGAEILVHSFRWGELRRLLAQSGFRIVDYWPLDEHLKRLQASTRWSANRATGWLVAAHRTGNG
jgi:ubiquinone/menaquinone biosynthesis C-methylase UbiE